MNFFSAEAVGIGHPDKIADKISDAIFDKALSIDKDVKFACEVLVSKNFISIAGEISSVHFCLNNNFSQELLIQKLEIKEIIKGILEDLDYDSSKFKLHFNLQGQSSNIQNSVVISKSEIGSGDQGIVFGYATNETPVFLPLAYVIARELVNRSEKLIRDKTFYWAKYDMKSLVVLKKQKNRFLLDTLVFSIQHKPNSITHKELVKKIEKYLIKPCLEEKYSINSNITNKFINSSGKFEIGGLDADSGATNRKLLVDSYGSICSHGGGGYSGKDLTKVDRLGAYYARWICKNIVASGICSSLELQIVYYLGCVVPVNFVVQQESASFSDKEVIKAIKDIFPQKISEIISIFQSSPVKYSLLSTYGHFGREDFMPPWERLDKVEEIKSYFGK